MTDSKTTTRICTKMKTLRGRNFNIFFHKKKLKNFSSVKQTFDNFRRMFDNFGCFEKFKVFLCNRFLVNYMIFKRKIRWQKDWKIWQFFLPFDQTIQSEKMREFFQKKCKLSTQTSTHHHYHITHTQDIHNDVFE